MSLESRVSKIELTLAGRRLAGRTFRLVGGTGTAGEPERFLAAQDMRLTANDIIICRTIYQAGASGPEVVPMDMGRAEA